MSNITYREYLEYKKLELQEIDPSSLSQEELAIYEIIKQDLANTQNIPDYVLSAQLFPKGKKLDAETIDNLAYIKEKISFKNSIYRFIYKISGIVSNFHDSKQKTVALRYATVAISFIIYVFLSASIPLDASISLPNITSQKISITHTNTVITPIPTSSNILPGVAGISGDDQTEKEKITFEITWVDTQINLGLLIWSVIPILAIFLAIYLPEIKDRTNS